MKKEENESFEDMDQMDEIGKILQEKFNEVKVPEQMFDTKRVFERYEREQKKKKKILRLASLVVIILMVCLAIGVQIHLNKNTEKLTPTGDNTDVIENSKNDDTQVVKSIYLKPQTIKFGEAGKYYFYQLEVEEILDYEIVDDMPYTKVKAKVLENYTGDTTGEIEMMVPGGVFTVKEIRENFNVQKEDLNGLKDEDKVEVDYYDSFYIPLVEEGKIYLATANMKDNKLYACNNVLYGFKEYNKNSNTIKDSDSSEIPANIEEYLSIIKK